MTQLGEYVKMALKNIWANKVRTLLTMLGIIIGISSVILIMSIGNGAVEMISEELGKVGSGQIQFYVADYDEKYLLTKEDMDELRELDGVKAVASQEIFEANTVTKKGDFSVNLITINADGFALLDYDFVYGGQYTEADENSGAAKCVITEDDAMKLYGSTNVVGKDLTIAVSGKYDVDVVICGVAKSDDSDLMAGLYVNLPVQVIISPQVIDDKLGYGLSENIYNFYVLKEDEADAKEVSDRVVEYLETKHHCKGKQVYAYQSFDDIMKTVNGVVKLITVFVAFVASVSLLVGGIGVMNIMLVSVTERTREIGIRKALGAKTGSITIQFLAESAFITLLGGVIGILVGICGAWSVANMIGMAVPTMHFAPKLSFGTILLASAFSTCVGLFFGIYPARKAAKMSPIEALRQN